MLPFAVKRGLLVLVVGVVAGQDSADSCPDGLASCTASDEEIALLQVKKSETLIACEDSGPQSVNCAHYKALGYCGGPNYDPNVQHTCRKTCGLCACVDHHPSCPSSGQACLSIDAAEQEHMRKICPWTCGNCGKYPSALQMNGAGPETMLWGFSRSKWYCNNYTSGCPPRGAPKTLKCHTVVVYDTKKDVSGKNVTIEENRCSGAYVNKDYIKNTWGKDVELIDWPKRSPPDGVRQQVFQQPLCGGLEQVGYAKSTSSNLTLYSFNQYTLNNSWGWSSYYTEAKWWFGEKTFSSTNITTLDYANKVAAVPWVPQVAIKCMFGAQNGFYVGSGAPRNTGSQDMKAKGVCPLYNVKSGTWKYGGIDQVQDPADDQLQIYMRAQDGKPHLPYKCWVCDMSDTKTPVWDQFKKNKWYSVAV